MHAYILPPRHYSGFFCAKGTKLKRRKTQELAKLKRKITKTQAKFSQNSDSRLPFQKKTAHLQFFKAMLLLTNINKAFLSKTQT